MRLSNEQKDWLIKRLDEFWKPTRCPACKHNEWSVSDTVYEVREFHGGTMVIGGGSLVPVIVATCEYCGYTLFFNAIKLGIVQPSKEETENE